VALRQGKGHFGRIWLLVVMLLLIGLVGFSCVRGMAPIGWSGGAVSDGVLYVGSKEGRLVAVGLNDSSRHFTEPLKASSQGGGLFGCSAAYGGGCGGGASGVAIYGTPVVSGDRVYIAGYNGKVYSYDYSSLQMDDVYPPEGYLESIVGGIVMDQGMLYFGASDGKVYALDADKLVWKWDFETGDKIWATPAISEGTVYIGSFDKKIYALDAADGRKKWEFETEGAIVATPLVSDGTVYIGSFDRHIYALNAYDGSLKWKFMAENWFWTRPLIYNGTIYAPCLDDKVYALRADTGDKLTEFDLGSPVSSSPVLFDDKVIVASRKGVVYSIDTVNNRVKQLVEIDEDIYGPLCISNGTVYAHTQDLTLHQIDVASGAVAAISIKSGE
jgi:outer membrane protein assembly factor BamB